MNLRSSGHSSANIRTTDFSKIFQGAQTIFKANNLRTKDEQRKSGRRIGGTNLDKEKQESKLPNSASTKNLLTTTGAPIVNPRNSRDFGPSNSIAKSHYYAQSSSQPNIIQAAMIGTQMHNQPNQLVQNSIPYNAAPPPGVTLLTNTIPANFVSTTGRFVSSPSQGAIIGQNLAHLISPGAPRESTRIAARNSASRDAFENSLTKITVENKPYRPLVDENAYEKNRARSMGINSEANSRDSSRVHERFGERFTAPTEPVLQAPILTEPSPSLGPALRLNIAPNVYSQSIMDNPNTQQNVSLTARTAANDSTIDKPAIVSFAPSIYKSQMLLQKPLTNSIALAFTEEKKKLESTISELSRINSVIAQELNTTKGLLKVRTEECDGLKRTLASTENAATGLKLQMQREASAHKDEVSSLQKRANEVQEMLNAEQRLFREKEAFFEKEVARLNQEIERSMHNRRDLLLEYDNERKKRIQGEEVIEQKTKDIHELQQNESTKSNSASKQFEQQNEEIEKLRSDLNQANADKERLTSALAQAKAYNIGTKNNTESLNSALREIEELKKSNNALAHQLKSSCETIEDMKNELEEMVGMAETDLQVRRELELKIQNLQVTSDDLRQELTKTQVLLTSQDQELSDLRGDKPTTDREKCNNLKKSVALSDLSCLSPRTNQMIVFGQEDTPIGDESKHVFIQEQLREMIRAEEHKLVELEVKFLGANSARVAQRRVHELREVLESKQRRINELLTSQAGSMPYTNRSNNRGESSRENVNASLNASRSMEKLNLRKRDTDQSASIEQNAGEKIEWYRQMKKAKEGSQLLPSVSSTDKLLNQLSPLNQSQMPQTINEVAQDQNPIPKSSRNSFAQSEESINNIVSQYK